MLGGRDFDRLLLDAHVRPWLQRTFSLPPDFQKDDRFRRLMGGVARHAAERARIDLTTAETATIHASDEDIRATDAAGADLYLSIDVTRRYLEALVADRIDESVALCRRMLKDNGVPFEDVSRLVPAVSDRGISTIGFDHVA